MGKKYAGIILIVLCLAAALVYEAKRTGLTIDEPSHFAAGFAYWLGEDAHSFRYSTPDAPHWRLGRTGEARTGSTEIPTLGFA